MAGAATFLRKKIRCRVFFFILALLPASASAQAPGDTPAGPTPSEPSPTATATRPLADAVQVGPSHCLDEATVLQQAQMWLGTDQVEARIAVLVEDRADGVHYVVSRDGSPIGQRTLDVAAVPCQQIHAALGLGIAAAIDATLLPTLSPEPPPPLPPPAPPPPPATVQPMPPAAPPTWLPPPYQTPPPSSNEDARNLRLTATGQAMVFVGVLPEVALGGAASFDVELVRWFDFRAAGLATAPVDAELGSGVAEVGLVAGRLDGCFVAILKEDVARVRGCAGFIAGAVQANGIGFDQPRTATAPWIGPAVRVDGRWSFGRHFGMLLGVDGLFPGVKPELEVESINSGETLASEGFPLAGIALSLGPSLTF